MDELNEGTPTEGVQFQQTGTLLITSNNYLIPIRIDQRDILDPLTSFQADLLGWYNRARIQTQSHDNGTHKEANKILMNRIEDINQYMVGYCQLMIDNVMDALESDTYADAHMRQKRATIFAAISPLVGLINSVITQYRINTLHSRLDNLTQQTDAHSKVINILANKQDRILEAQKRMELATQTTYALAKANMRDVSYLQQHVLLLNSIDQVYATFNDLRLYAEDIVIGLTRAWRGHLDTSLIPMSYLKSVMNSMIANGHIPLFPPKKDYIQLIYEIAHVTPKPLHAGSLVLYLAIPMAGNPDIAFDVYKVMPFPLRVPNSDLFEEAIPEDEHLIISKDRGYYVRPNLADCLLVQSLRICPTSTLYSVFSAPSCLTQAYLKSNTPDLKCPKRIMKSFYPRFIKTDEGLLYSTDSKLEITAYCNNIAPNPPTRRIITLIGAGVLTSVNSCRLRSSAFLQPSGSTVMREELQVGSKHFVSHISADTLSAIKDLDSAAIDDKPDIKTLLQQGKLKRLFSHVPVPLSWLLPLGAVVLFNALCALACLARYLYLKRSLKESSNGLGSNVPGTPTRPLGVPPLPTYQAPSIPPA